MKSLQHFLPAYMLPRYISGRGLVRGLIHAIALCLVLCSLSSIASAQTAADNEAGVASEARVKAAYLYKFVNYVEWPGASFAKSDSPYVIGIVNAADVAAELAALAAGRTINNRIVSVRAIRTGEPISGVHVLFLGAGERTRQLQLLKQSQQEPALLVTETEGALMQGSMINFRLADNRVRFEVALGPVETAGLKLSSRLLGVALSVTKGARQ